MDKEDFKTCEAEILFVWFDQNSIINIFSWPDENLMCFYGLAFFAPGSDYLMIYWDFVTDSKTQLKQSMLIMGQTPERFLTLTHPKMIFYLNHNPHCHIIL